MTPALNCRCYLWIVGLSRLERREWPSLTGMLNATASAGEYRPRVFFAFAFSIQPLRGGSRADGVRKWIEEMKIWGRDTSVNVQKVLWALDEAGKAYDRIDAGGAFGGLDTEEFGRLNPNRKVPVIEDDGFVLWESGAIVRYVGEAHAPGTLVPADLRTRALAAQWSDWCNGTVYTDFIYGVFHHIVRVKAEDRDNGLVANNARLTGERFAILENAMGDHRYIVSDELTFADIEIGALLHRYFTLPIERPDLPKLKQLYERLQERPGYRAHVVKDWTLMKIPGA